jgi:hypothetical protein
MVRHLILSTVVAVTLVGGSLLILGESAAAQVEWNRPVTESGPAGPVQVGSLGAAFYARSPYDGPVDMTRVGIYWDQPMDITRGPRGEDLTAGTYGAAFRTGPPSPPPPPARAPEPPGRGPQR